TFSTPHGLTQHVNAIHQRRLEISQSIQQRPQQLQHSQGLQAISRLKRNENLWSMPIIRTSRTIPSTTYAENPKEIEDVVFEENISNLDVISNIEDNTTSQNEPRYCLRNLSNKIEHVDQEMIADTSDKEISDEELP
ncbi:12055_t:CDS:1, partial [Racocetra fulgida]